MTDRSVTDHTALIDGGTGAYLNEIGTLTNYGAFAGGQGPAYRGYAVQFQSPTDTLVVEAGSTFLGAVSGASVVEIRAATADFTSTFTQSVVFGATGVLELADSQAYAGTITGFSKTGATSLDLADIAFGTGTKASYSGTTASGVLTVTDGTHTAKFKLAGNYTTSTFSVSSDGHGGTTVLDPTKATSTHAFIAAMASFRADAGGPITSVESPTMAQSTLAIGR